MAPQDDKRLWMTTTSHVSSSLEGRPPMNSHKRDRQSCEARQQILQL